MKKIDKKGLAALLLAAVLGGYGVQMVSVHAAEEEISLDFSDETEPVGENSAEVSMEDIDEFSSETDIDQIEEGNAEEDNTEEDIVVDEESLFEEEDILEEETAEDLGSDFTETKSCGVQENTVFWTLDTEGILTITGQGDMQDWQTEEEVPWNVNRSEIKKIEIADGVTSIGAYAFSDCINVIETEIPDSVQEIGEYAFFNCNGLSSMTIG